MFPSAVRTSTTDDNLPPYRAGKPAAALDTLFAQKRVAAAVRKQELPFLQRQLSRPDALVLDLDAPAAQMGCVIMASGLGRRFGGSKLLAEFCARPLLHYTLQATSGLFADRVVVTRSAEAACFAQSCGVRTVLHTLPVRRAGGWRCAESPPAACALCAGAARRGAAGH